jgi:sugar lactone lactonase YvrE
VITSAPPAITFDTAAAFSFTDTKAGVTFLCSLDGATFASCTSGVSYTVPALTGYTVFTWHSFAVEAKDNAGNVSAETTLTWMLRSETWLITADPVNFGALPVGQTSSAQAVTFTFTASDTIATIDATTMGIAGLDFTVSDPGTCAVNTAVSKGSTCTLHATFSPKFSGLRKGGVVLLGAAGNGIAAVYLQGVGTAPQLTFTPYSTTFFNVLPPQNNADPGKDLATWVTDAAVDGAGNIYITDGDIGSVDGSVAVSVGSLWEFPVGCTTAACIKLISTEEGASGQQSTSASLLLPNTLVMDGTGMLWGTNWSLAPFVFSTVGNWSLPTGAWYAVDCFLPWVATTIYPNGSAVDGAGISSFVANGMLAVCGSQVGVASTASGQSSSAGGTKDKPQAIGGGGNSLSFDFSASTTGLTVDPEGNIFVADAGNNAIKEVLASSNYTIDRTVGGSVFNNPGGLASDANGNIFVADIGSNTLKEIVAASGYTQVLTIATFDSKAVDFGGFVNGYANNFTIDTLGNIYIANQSNTLNDQLVKLDIADAPSLNFPTATKIGTTDTTDGTLTATVKNIGNQPLTIGGLALSNNNFMIDASATTCSASAPLAAGSACTVGVLFTPNGSGALTGTLTLTDNALNQSGATQQFALSGTGYATPTTTTPAVAVAPTSSSITTAQSDQVTVTVSGTSGSPTPTGTVSLFGGNYTSVTVALSGGQASFTIPAGVLAVGSTTLNAVYTPDAASSTTYGTGAGSTAITVTAVPASTPIVTVTPASIDVSTQQSLTVTIAVSGNPTPTGSVTLAGGNYASLAVTLISGSATITIPAGYLPAGTDTLIAYYTPDPAGKANYNSASGNGQVVAEAGSETMTPTVTVTPASSNISSSQSLQVTMQVSGGSGNATPTGSVILSSGSYASAAAPLYNGSVTLSIPAGTLAVGSNTLVANYAPDTASTLTYTGASGSNTVNAAAAVTAGDFGTIPVGQSGGPILLTFSFTGSGTIGSVTAMMQGAPAMDFAVVSGGSCAAGMSYNSGDICTANVTFSPQFAGLRYGVVIVKDSSGNTVATDFVNGTGSGPQVRLVPKYPRITPPWPTLGGGLSPAGLVADGIGDVFVADANASTGTVVAKEVPAGCMSATCVITLAPTYTLGNKPTKGQSVALDSIGNVFIATSGGGVYEITVASGYQTAITLANGFAFTGPTGLAVDQSGNVFIAAGANGGTENGVYEIPAAGGYATVNQVATGLIDPIGLAVDMNGNLFVSTASNGTANPNGVYEISATSGYTMFQAVGSGFSSPQGLTVDQDGNVFVLDTSYYGIYEILAAGGYTTVDALPLDLYERITVDASGNIYLPSSGGGTIDKVEFADALMIFRTATTVQTADTTDSPLPFTVQNIGNAELNLTAITPPSANFTIDSGTTTCSTSTPLAAGASCIVGVDFAPAAVGALSGTLTLTDNNLNASNATQDVYLSGTGAAAPTVATPVIAPPTGTYYTNQSVTITDSTANAVICYTTDNTAPTASNGTCTHGTAYGGAISVVQTGAVVQAIGTLAGDNNSALATATYTLQAVAPTLLPPGGTYVGAQSVTLSTTTTGSQIYYTTDGTTPTGAAPSILYNSATPIAVIASGTVINAIAVYDGYQNSTVSTGTYILQYPAVTLTSSLTFTAGVGATSAAQSATLQNTGTAPLTGIVISIAGTDLSNFTQTATTCGATLAAGASCTISVTFSPTAVTSYSATISVADNAAGSPQTTVLNGTGIAPTFTVASATPTQTVQPGGAATYTINVNPVNGSYTSAVTLTASGLPSGATASFSPNPVTPGAEGTSSTLTVQTAAPVTTAANLRWPLAAPALALIGILFLPRRRARHWLALGILMLASLGALTLSGCGGGFYSGSASHSYTITVTGTSGTDVQTTTVQLTVE